MRAAGEEPEKGFYEIVQRSVVSLWLCVGYFSFPAHFQSFFPSHFVIFIVFFLKRLHQQGPEKQCFCSDLFTFYTSIHQLFFFPRGVPVVCRKKRGGETLETYFPFSPESLW